MKKGSKTIFINPDLLKSQCGFEMLSEYLSTNTVEKYSIISEIVDGKLKISSPSSSVACAHFHDDVLIYFDATNINCGYWKMTLESLKNFLGIK